ncbi:hypothetical protein EMPG_12477 [Blastomyces silverae]|uniref:Uncharacterized protein n=1 Tax=Blastomyces silverae TaxID=2060906 RepID=A0A0H1BLU9_9EURO|nr:hypothetical protein EMPG_12477 [Blastomyces silverae]
MWITSSFSWMMTFSYMTTPAMLLTKAPAIAGVCLGTNLCSQKIHGSKTVFSS